MATRKKSQHPEYRLLVTPHTNERTLKPTTMFILETAQRFASFRYELSVKEVVTERSISFTILGLKAPGLNLPSAGRASYSREFESLKGAYDITVVGLDGQASVCKIHVAPGRVDIVKEPPAKGLRVTTDPGQFSQE
jgi:hypothetical protein